MNIINKDKLSFEEIEKINDAKIIAMESINKFLLKLNLDPDAFSHLQNINIKIVKYDTMGEYRPNNNTIIISIKNLKEKPTLEIALTLVHEILHANRSLFIYDGINAKELNELNKENVLSDKIVSTKKHNINEYIYILEKKLTTEEKNKFPKYIPINITQNDDNTFNVIAHNKYTKHYEEFNNIVLNNNEKYPNGELFEIIGLILNDKNNNYISSKIDLIEKNNNKIITANDYYHPTNESDTINNLNIDHAVEIIDDQNNFEEVMVESIAHIIIMSRNDNDIDLDKICNKLENSNTSDIDTTLCVKLIKAIGPNILKWFMLSCYEDTYYNMFLQTIQENYEELIQNFSYLYDTIIYNEEIDKDNVNNINYLINEISNKKK